MKVSIVTSLYRSAPYLPEFYRRAKGAVYAQSADWTAKEAEGFIRLVGQSSEMSARINPIEE